MGREIELDKNITIVSETDASGKILYANDDFCKIAGYTKDELIGQPHNIIRNIDMPKVAFKDLWETIQAGKVWKGIVKNNTKNRDFYWVHATAYKVVKSGVTKYISVRVKPTAEEVASVIPLYKQLRGEE